MCLNFEFANDPLSKLGRHYNMSVSLYSICHDKLSMKDYKYNKKSHYTHTYTCTYTHMHIHIYKKCIVSIINDDYA
jgi:hypothetical protein